MLIYDVASFGYLKIREGPISLLEPGRRANIINLKCPGKHIAIDLFNVAYNKLNLKLFH